MRRLRAFVTFSADSTVDCIALLLSSYEIATGLQTLVQTGKAYFQTTASKLKEQSVARSRSNSISSRQD